MSIRKGKVLYANILAGEIREREDLYEFQYVSEYLESPSPKAVSLTLPLQKEPFQSQFLFSFFDGLIPEGWLLEVAAKNWKIDPRDRMGLLYGISTQVSDSPLTHFLYKEHS